ncbi:MAG: DUF7453 family protein [Phycisphaerales bacterium]
MNIRKSAFLAWGGLLVVAALAPAAPAAAASLGGPTFSTAAREGQTVPGVGLITRIDNLVVNNSGQWIVEVDTDNVDLDRDAVLLNQSGLLLREGDSVAMPAGASIGSFDAITLSNDGDSGWNFFLDGTGGSSDDSGIYWNTTLVIQEGDLSISSDFSSGTVYRGFFETKIGNSNDILILATVDDPNIPSTSDRALVIAELNDTGGLLDEHVIAKEGDILPGQSAPVADFETGPHEFAMNAAGDVLYLARMDTAPAVDTALYRNQTLLAQEGDDSPVDGRAYELLTRAVDVARSGNYAFRANLDGDITNDEVIIVNGTVLAREGHPVDGIFPDVLSSLGSTTGPIQISNAGELLWYGEWNDGNSAALFIDEEILVEAGVTRIGARTVISISNVQDAFAMSDNGVWIIFEATLDNGLGGAFLIERPETTDRFATLLSFNVTFGSLVSGTLADLALSDDVYLRTASQFGFLSSEPNVMTLEVEAAATGSPPASLDVRIESRLNNPLGQVSVRLRNWLLNRFDGVDQYVLNTQDQVNVTANVPAGDYVRTSDDHIRLSMKHVVVATFSVTGFRAFHDHVQIRLN